MSKPISDAQIYALLVASHTTYGTLSVLHNCNGLTRTPSGRLFELHRTALDRLQVLGLVKRGLFVDTGKGYWRITDAGIAELKRPTIVRRIDAIADATHARSMEKEP